MGVLQNGRRTRRITRNTAKSHAGRAGPAEKVYEKIFPFINGGNMNKGRIEVICGPMFSGKSEELLRRLNRASIAKRKFELFKPAIDDRYSEDEVVSHSGQAMSCTPLINAHDIVEQIAKDTKIVAVDEAQFFDFRLVATVLELTRQGKRVVIAGLDMDSSGVPFGPVPQLMAMAEEVTKLTAVCEACGEPATHSYRKSEEGSQLLVGATDHYEARCREHWDRF